jgi:hypothetical protein
MNYYHGTRIMTGELIGFFNWFFSLIWRSLITKPELTKYVVSKQVVTKLKLAIFNRLDFANVAINHYMRIFIWLVCKLDWLLVLVSRNKAETPATKSKVLHWFTCVYVNHTAYEISIPMDRRGLCLIFQGNRYSKMCNFYSFIFYSTV